MANPSAGITSPQLWRGGRCWRTLIANIGESLTELLSAHEELPKTQLFGRDACSIRKLSMQM